MKKELKKAIEKNDLETVKYLVENGADVNVKNDDGYTPLHIATCSNNLEIVKYLVENGADVNSSNKDGYFIATFASDEVIDIIIDYIDTDEKNIDNYNIIQQLAMDDDYEKLKFILNELL